MAADRSSPVKVVTSYCAAMFALNKQYYAIPEAERTEEATAPIYAGGWELNCEHCTRPHRLDSIGWPSPHDAEITEVTRITDDRVHVHTQSEHPDVPGLFDHHRYTVERKSDGWRISAEDAVYDDGLIFDLWRDVDARIGQLFDEHLGSFFDKQERFAELIGDENWEYDTQSGKLGFGDRYSWHAQILGTESQSRFSWRWSWANDASGLPGPITQYARAMRAFGEKHGLADFTTPSFPCGVLGGWKLMMIGCGLAKAPAAFRAPQDDNLTVFMLIDDPAYPSPKGSETNVGLRIATIFPQVLEQAEQHPRAFEGYLRYYGLRPEIERLAIRGLRGTEVVVTAHFDDKKRLVKIEA